MSMYDFTAGFSPNAMEESGSRKDSLLDSVIRGLQNMSAPKQTVACVDLKFVFDYLSGKCKEYPQCQKCLLYIEQKNGLQLVTMILLDAQNSPLRTTTKEVRGVRLKAETLGEDLLRFMEGKSSCIVMLPKQDK